MQFSPKLFHQYLKKKIEISSPSSSHKVFRCLSLTKVWISGCKSDLIYSYSFSKKCIKSYFLLPYYTNIRLDGSFVQDCLRINYRLKKGDHYYWWNYYGNQRGTMGQRAKNSVTKYIVDDSRIHKKISYIKQRKRYTKRTKRVL